MSKIKHDALVLIDRDGSCEVKLYTYADNPCFSMGFESTDAVEEWLRHLRQSLDRGKSDEVDRKLEEVGEGMLVNAGSGIFLSR
jgi:hypothetical protein